MATAFIQEFAIVDGDTRTENYDAVVEQLGLGGNAPAGLLLHTAGFDHDGGVFRIFDVWETREHGERFMRDTLEPITGRMAEAAQQSGEDFQPPTRRGMVRAPRLDVGLTGVARRLPPSIVPTRAADGGYRGSNVQV